MKNRLMISKRRLQQLGQGMTEYIIIVALIAIAGIAAYSCFGQTMQGAVADVSTELSGQQSKDTAKTGAAEAQKEASTVEGMGTYDDNQQGQK
jgi:Flp pilus assembly pilin Flp